MYRGSEVRELVIGKLLSPKLPRMLLEGMVPSCPPTVLAGGGGSSVYVHD